MTEPQTEAGRALFERALFVPEMSLGEWRRSILAIEAEAREQGRQEPPADPPLADGWQELDEPEP